MSKLSLYDIKLERLREILSVVQVSLGVLTVILGGGGSTAALALAFLFSTLAFLRPLKPTTPKLHQRMWTWGVVIALIASGTRAAFNKDFLDAGVDFLLLLVVQRFFNRQRTREHLQLLMLGAVLVIIGAVINADLNFPLLLSVFLPVTTMAMLVNHLLAESERLGPRVRYELQRQGPTHYRLFWRWALQVAGVAALSGLFVFVVFPRFGVGLFFRGSLNQDTRSGFSEEIRLGEFGNIKDDTSVVMHLEPVGEWGLDQSYSGEKTRLPWHFRGSAFDHYENGLWGHSPLAQTTGVLRDRNFWFFADAQGRRARMHRRTGVGRGGVWQPKARALPGFAESERTVHMQVTLENIGTELLFAAAEPLGAALSPRGAIERRHKIGADVDQQLRVIKRQPGPIRYEFASRLARPSRDELLAVGNPVVPPAIARAYLQLPDNLSLEFQALATTIADKQTSRLQKVEALMKHLSSFRYTTQKEISLRVQAGADPIEGFLFDTRAGHCEYFASALALLLRQVGVPTRNVNGYYGAQYNQLGDFYAVRQSDAHSWVEVYFDGLGWVTFDPTPPAGRVSQEQTSWAPGFSQLVGALRNAYLNYVIDYDLGKQIRALERLGVSADSNRHRLKFDWKRIALWTSVPLLFGLGFVLFRYLRKRQEVPHIVWVYQTLLDQLAQHGWSRNPTESPTQLAVRIANQTPPLGDALFQFAQHYERLRFGSIEHSLLFDAHQELQRLAERVKGQIGKLKASLNLKTTEAFKHTMNVTTSHVGTRFLIYQMPPHPVVLFETKSQKESLLHVEP